MEIPEEEVQPLSSIVALVGSALRYSRYWNLSELDLGESEVEDLRAIGLVIFLIAPCTLFVSLNILVRLLRLQSTHRLGRLCQPIIYPVHSKLTSLNLSYATIQIPSLGKLISDSHNLQRVWRTL